MVLVEGEQRERAKERQEKAASSHLEIVSVHKTLLQLLKHNDSPGVRHLVPRLEHVERFEQVRLFVSPNVIKDLEAVLEVLQRVRVTLGSPLPVAAGPFFAYFHHVLLVRPLQRRQLELLAQLNEAPFVGLTPLAKRAVPVEVQ